MTDPVEVARYSSTTQASTATVPITHATTVGQRIILAAQAPSVTAETAFTITDTKATWTQRIVEAHTTPVNSQVVVFDGVVTTAHTTSDTLSVHSVNRSPACWAVLALAFDDLTGYDVSAGAVGSGTALASGNTAAGAQDSELIFGAFGFIDTGGSETFTPGSGFTAPAKVNAALATPKSLAVAYKYVNAAGARAASATLSGSANWVAAAAVFTAPPPVPPTPYYWFNAAGVKVPMSLTPL